MRTKITFLYTNDIHGILGSFNAVECMIGDYEDESVVVIDAGDTFSEDFDGRIIEECLTDLFDIWTPGNHDFMTFSENVKNIMAKEKPVTLCANVKDKNNAISSHIILDIKGYRFLFIGFCSGVEGSDFVNEDIGKVYSEIIGKYRYMVDFCVIVSHLGLNEDIRFARNTSEIDIIIGGHSHSEVKSPYVVNKTLIAQAGGFGKYAGILDIFIEKGKIKEFRNRLVPSKKFEVNPKMLKRHQKERKDKDSIFHLEKDICFEKFSENRIIDIFLEELLENTDAELVLVNSSIFKICFYKGDLTRDEIKGFFNYPVEFQYIYLSLDEIRKIIKRSEREEFLKIHRCYRGDEFPDIFKIKTVVSDFLGEGGQFGGSLYPELKNKIKLKADIDNLSLLEKALKKYFSEYINQSSHSG